MTDNSNLEKMDIDAEAINLMAQGKRHLIVHDYYSAVLSLEEACRLFDSKYGVNADECSEAYLKYGCALLELHRQETGALDGLIDPKPQEEEDDEEEEEEEEVEDEENEEATKAEEKNDETVKTEEDIMESPKQVETESTVEDSKMEASSSDADANKPSTSTGITDENREEEETEPSNIEVAFEVLTMAKNIFKRQTEHRDDVFLKLSETLQKLGEIFIEWENNNDAIKELEECLEIRKRHLPDDDRLIAETYYHIGLAYSFNSNIDQANSNFQKAVDVIEQRLNRLKKIIEENSMKKEELDQEIIELESILPEMKSKIEDCQEQMSTTKLAANDKLEEEKMAEKKKQILAKPISNVSHLVKRKREEPELNGNKKLKNGDSNQNGHNKEAVEMQEV